MQMSLSTPPSTPRKRTSSLSKNNPVTPSTCDSTPLFTPASGPRRRTPSAMEELSLSSGYPSPCPQWEGIIAQQRFPRWEASVPQVLDKVSVSLMSFLPKMEQDGQHGGAEFKPGSFKPTETMGFSSATWGKLQPPPMQGQSRSPSPSTPKRSADKQARETSRSPPPAPKQKKVRLGKALEENDLLQVVEILAKHSHLATMPFMDDGNYELPLERATRLRCDEMILELLRDNGAGRIDAENQPRNRIQFPDMIPQW